MEWVTFAKFSIAHKLQVVSFLRCYHAYVDIWLPSMDNEHKSLAIRKTRMLLLLVGVVRDSLLKGKTGQNSKQLREFVI